MQDGLALLVGEKAPGAEQRARLLLVDLNWRVGAEDEPQCKHVCPTDCIVQDPDHVELREELMAKYEALNS